MSEKNYLIADVAGVWRPVSRDWREEIDRGVVVLQYGDDTFVVNRENAILPEQINWVEASGKAAVNVAATPGVIDRPHPFKGAKRLPLFSPSSLVDKDEAEYEVILGSRVSRDSPFFGDMLKNLRDTRDIDFESLPHDEIIFIFEELRDRDFPLLRDIDDQLEELAEMLEEALEENRKTQSPS